MLICLVEKTSCSPAEHNLQHSQEKAHFHPAHMHVIGNEHATNKAQDVQGINYLAM